LLLFSNPTSVSSVNGLGKKAQTVYISFLNLGKLRFTSLSPWVANATATIPRNGLANGSGKHQNQTTYKTLNIAVGLNQIRVLRFWVGNYLIRVLHFFYLKGRYEIKI